MPVDTTTTLPLRPLSDAPFAWAGVTAVLALVLAVTGIVLALVAVTTAPPNTTSAWPALDKTTALLCVMSLGIASWRLSSVFRQAINPAPFSNAARRTGARIGLFLMLSGCLFAIGLSVRAVTTVLRYPPDPTFVNARSFCSQFAFSCGLISNILSIMSMSLLNYWQGRRITQS